jgi:hypothetical protein
MATPRYDALVDKVRDWSNKPEVNTIPDSVIQDCLGYSADECYRTLRIPPLEATITYTVESTDNVGDGSAGLPYGNAYTCFDIPEDLIQFTYVRTLAQDNIGTSYSTYPSNVSKVFNEVTDSRTFFDLYSEKYSVYNWMWKDGKVFIHPQLAVGAQVEISYYRRLPALNATYSVIPVNYVIGLSDAAQPYLTLTGVNTDIPLYFSTANSIMRCFATLAEAQAYNPTVTTKYYVGQEVPNWLRDENERLLIWGALYNLGSYLFDEKMEQRYEKKFAENVFSLNKEEKWRRASGGNVQVNFNTNGLI